MGAAWAFTLTNPAVGFEPSCLKMGEFSGGLMTLFGGVALEFSSGLCALDRSCPFLGLLLSLI